MPPPIRPVGAGPAVISSAAEGSEARGGERPAPSVRPAPLLQLRPEIQNPIRSSRPISTLGDIRDAIVYDFIRDRLGPGGIDVVQRLGSFPGYLHPETPLHQWSPDQKPDVNIIGDTESILRNLAPLMGWNDRALEANLQRARQGMVYFNVAIETPAGPVPFKMGILNTRVWEGGETYFSLRASLLPRDSTYIYLNEDPAFRRRFEDWLSANNERFLRDTLRTIVFRRDFTADHLTRRHFELHFQAYESYRVFDWFKGSKHWQKMLDHVSEIMAPGLRNYLQNYSDLKVFHPDFEGPLRSEDITTQIYPGLRFEWQNSLAQRGRAFLKGLSIFAEMNRSNGRQTLRNIGSNGTSRPGYHRVGWLQYGLRKFKRFFGFANDLTPRSFTADSSYFSTTNQRLGQTGAPVRQMIILAGYDPGNEERPEVFQEIARYAENEIRKGAVPNPLFKGIEPSKFTLPIRGIPSVAYQLMNGLQSEGLQNVVLVGAPDTRIIFDRFCEFYSREIAERGKHFVFVETGRNFTDGLRKGMVALDHHQEPVVVGFGDTPLIDTERNVYHPERWLVDWAVGVNSRTRMLHDGAKNYHGDGQSEGIHDPAKEGNLMNYPGDPARIPWDVLQAIFDSRKSMSDGGTSKGRILTNLLLRNIYRPNTWHFAADFAWRTLGLQYERRVLGRKVPAFGLDVDLSERILESNLNWSSSIAPSHIDPGGVLDIDGVLDLALAKAAVEETEHPERVYPHWEKLAPFAEALEPVRDQLPALQNTPERINRLFERLRQEYLRRGFSQEQLRRKGFSPDIPPMLEDGRVNPEYLEILFPNRSARYFQNAVMAYRTRGEHARNFGRDFSTWVQETQAYPADQRVPAEIGRFIFGQFNIDPERTRSLIIEWDFGRIEQALMLKARGKFGPDSEEVGQLQRYLEQSTTERQNTPLRRVLSGLKAVDVLRRYLPNISPEEFRSLYPTLVECIHDAQRSVPGNFSRLHGFLGWAHTTADREFVRKVGESPPPFRARGVGGLLRHSNGRTSVTSSSGAHDEGLPRRVDSPVYFSQDVLHFAWRVGIMPSRLPHLIAAASGANSLKNLNQVSHQRMTLERLQAWVQSPEGQAYMREQGDRVRDTFRNRLLEQGPGLGLGIATLFGAEYLADRIGIDARHHPQERFMFVVGASHLTNLGTSSVSEVLLNRALGQPFSFVSTRTVAAGSEAALQYSFEARSGLGRALGASLLRNFGLEGGVARMAWNGTKNLTALPFRTAWGMGSGLMASALVDRTLGRWFFEEGSTGRNALRFGSFFLPDIYRLAVGHHGPALFETPALRYAGKAFAAGFIADMLFLGAQRLQYGAEGSATQLSIYQQANRLHDEQESFLRRPLDGLFEMLAPSLAAWWDSVEFNWHDFHFRPNPYQNEVRQDLQRFSLQTSEQAEGYLRNTLIHGAEGQALDPSFYTDVNWDYLRGDYSLRDIRTPDGRELPVEMVFEQLSQPSIHERRIQGRSHEDHIRYIREQFSGFDLSRADAEIILDRIAAHRIRTNLSQLHQFEIPQNAAMRSLFDARGNLIAGQEGRLVRTVFGGQQVSESELLRLRQVALAVHILQLRSEGTPAAQEDLNRYLSVARRIGITDAEGNLISGEIQRIAQAQLESSRPISALGSTAVALNSSPHSTLL